MQLDNCTANEINAVCNLVLYVIFLCDWTMRSKEEKKKSESESITFRIPLNY